MWPPSNVEEHTARRGAVRTPHGSRRRAIQQRRATWAWGSQVALALYEQQTLSDGANARQQCSAAAAQRANVRGSLARRSDPAAAPVSQHEHAGLKQLAAGVDDVTVRNATCLRKLSVSDARVGPGLRRAQRG